MASINAVGNALTGSTGTGSFVGSVAPSIRAPVILDTNGVNALTVTTTASAVNYVTIANRGAGSYPYFLPVGTDTNIGIQIAAKGSGTFQTTSTSNTGIFMFTGTAYQHTTNFTFANTAANRIVTFPDADFTVAPTVSPSFTTPTLGVATATSINFGGNAFNKYTVGNWTPVLVSSGGGTCTYGTQSGSYTWIGNILYFAMTIVISGSTLGAGTITITGLPQNNTAQQCSLPLYMNSVGATTATQVMATVGASNAIISLWYFAAGAASAMTATQIGTTAQIIISGCYQTS